MLVISTDAAAEATRLARRSTIIDVVLADARIIKAVTAIDGAVLLSPELNIHAIGVILDGVATATIGDSSRGARHNSAATPTL